MYIHIEVPVKKVALLEFVGLVFDTGIILEDELEVRGPTPLDKMDRYFYENYIEFVQKQC